ncbi:MAG: hypothetical protein IKH73_04025, partial [Erysipelotrichaceae bacterium]|nr:hypothetical protein [Erysipelotrichaceae bacterium]
MKEFYKKIKAHVFPQPTGEDVFRDNEVQANSILSLLAFNTAIILIVSWLLNEVGFFPIEKAFYSGFAL